MSVNYKKSGFTLVELLTVIVIMAILLGVLVPALTMVRNTARKAKQKAQFGSIDQALIAFRSDIGDYPPSVMGSPDYCGAQKLAEALLGQDLLGFHPGSLWDAAGLIYDTTVLTPLEAENNLNQRVGPYLELGTTSAFTLEQLFGPTANFWGLQANRFVICDSYGVKKVSVGKKVVNAGTPILYYRANISSKTMEESMRWNNIYSSLDNAPLCTINSLANNQPHPLSDDQLFYNENNKVYKIIDQKASAAAQRSWPHRPDSYILISAGPDGLYGNEDDITNF